MARDDVQRQVQQHLQSLQRAGLEWLPRGAALEWTPALAAAAPAGTSGAAEPSAATASAATLLAEAAAQPSAAGDLEDRRRSLDVLAEQIKTCTLCKGLASTRTQTVFADGTPGAELCFIGEAPGADEDAQGLPFVGAAGQLLNRIIVAMGFKREEVYICNILKCRPPGNRTPLPDEAANCRPFLERQLELAQPRFICCLGSTAVTHLLQTTKSLGSMRGRFHDYKGIPVIVTYHPAYLLPHRNPDKKKDVWEDMKMLLTRMGRPIPETKRA